MFNLFRYLVQNLEPDCLLHEDFKSQIDDYLLFNEFYNRCE